MDDRSLPLVCFIRQPSFFIFSAWMRACVERTSLQTTLERPAPDTFSRQELWRLRNSSRCDVVVGHFSVLFILYIYISEGQSLLEVSLLAREEARKEANRTRAKIENCGIVRVSERKLWKRTSELVQSSMAPVGQVLVVPAAQVAVGIDLFSIIPLDSTLPSTPHQLQISLSHSRTRIIILSFHSTF